MISKIITALMVSSISLAAYSADLSLKTVEGAKILDGNYHVKANKDRKTYSSSNGDISGKKISKEVTLNKDGKSKTFKSDQLITKGGNQYTVHFLGRQEGGHEHGYFQVKKANKVVSRGMYNYSKQ
jgi:hypothetical protein